MTYELKPVRPEDEQRIFSDADEQKRLYLQMRGGYFKTQRSLDWAIDTEQNHYLVQSPSLSPMSRDLYFYMMFEGRMYQLRVRKGIGPEVQIKDEVLPEDLDRLRQEITEAFRTLRLDGNAFTPLFVSNFPGDGE